MQTTTPGAFQDDKATKALLHRLGTVSNSLNDVRHELVGARDQAQGLAGEGGAAGGAAQVRVAGLLASQAALQQEQRQLQERLASADSVPKQVLQMHRGRVVWTDSHCRIWLQVWLAAPSEQAVEIMH